MSRELDLENKEIERLIKLVQSNYQAWNESAKRSLEKDEEIKKLKKQLGLEEKNKYKKEKK